MSDVKEIIARRAARELHDGDIVNLGIGLPTLVTDYLDSDIEVILQSENGILGMKGAAEPHEINPDVTNAGGSHVSVHKFASFFDSATSFGFIRGGHVDVTILGALQVDRDGSLASHIVPGMGGAMDLVAGAKNVIVVMTHTAKGDAPKILEKCTLPLTAYKKVNRIITELAVIDVTADGLVLREINKNTTVEDVVRLTEAKLVIPENIETF